MSVRREGEGLIPPSDPDAESWLKKSSDAAGEGQWKLAADTLARVIDQYGDKTVSNDGQHYLSALSNAQQQIAAWPKEGIEVYRLLNDQVVAQQLEKARKDSDVASLREICRKYPLTTPGPDAISLLADLLIDRRQYGEAIALLHQLQQLPHNNVPAWKTLGRLAISLAMARQHDDAVQAIQQLQGPNAQTSPARPADWATRLEVITQFVDQSASKDVLNVASLASIPQDIEPAVTPEAPWFDFLPGTSRLDQAIVTKLSKNTGRPPVWQIANDKNALFVSSPDGLMARDLSTFELLWKTFPRAFTRDTRIIRLRQQMGVGEVDNKDRLDEPSTRALFQEFRGGVTAAKGLVFVIEQGPSMDEMYPSKEGAVPPNEGVALEPNSIRAFEADTGRAAWTIGRGGSARVMPARRITNGRVDTRRQPGTPEIITPGDSVDLRFAHFFSPPVEVGEFLVAPYQLENDFYLAVLRRDGTADRHVLIGSGQPGMMPVNALLTPVVDDDAIYVQTSGGLFVALSRFDFSLKWLSMYDRVRGRGEAGTRRVMPFGPAQHVFAQPDEWLSSPPLPMGGLILLAAHDSEYLQAFDRVTGELKWSFPRGDYRYVVGSDGKRVFLSGRGILAVDLNKGNGLWSQSKFKPTGRLLLCRSADVKGATTSAPSPDSFCTLLVPTDKGLIRLDGSTGQTIGDLLPSLTPLGNLAYIDGALYSIGPKTLAKYPDLAQSRMAALAALEKNPQDYSALLRMAWLNKLQKNWSQALEYLDKADSAFEHEKGSHQAMPNDPENADLFPDRVAHQRVEILLHLADSADEASRGQFIDRAFKAATSSKDLILAGLALSDLLAEQGKRIDAFKCVLDLVVRAGNEPMILENELIATAIVALRERMQSLYKGAAESERAELEKLIAQKAEGVKLDLNLQTAERLSDAIPFSVRAAELDLAIGRECLRQRQFESASFFLERCSQRGKGKIPGRDALFQLVALYAHPGSEMVCSPGLVDATLKRLRDNYHLDKVPTDIDSIASEFKGVAFSRLPELCGISAANQSKNGSVAILEGNPILELIYDSSVLITTMVPPFRICDASAFFDRSRPDGGIEQWGAAGDMVVLRASRQLRALDTRSQTNEVYWTSNLEPSIEATDVAVPALNSPEDAAYFANVGVFGGKQVCGVGLSTGLSLWPPIPVEGDKDSLPKPFVVQHDGIVMFAPQPSTLIAICARNGATPIWRRQFPNHRLSVLRVVDGYFVALDEALSTMFVIDPESGRIFRQVDISESASLLQAMAAVVNDEERGNDAFAAIAGRMICRSGYKRVVTRDVVTGRKLWDLSLKGRVTRIMRLDDEYLGICYRSQHFLIVRADTGEVVRDELLDGLVLPPEDATLDRDGEARVLIFANTDDDPPEYSLVSLPLRKEADTWRQPLGRLAICNTRMMRTSPRFVPVVDVQLQPGAGRNLLVGGANRVEANRLQFYDKQTGRKMLAEPFSFPIFTQPQTEFSPEKLIGDVIVLDNRIVAISAESYYVLGKAKHPQATAFGGESDQ